MMLRTTTTVFKSKVLSRSTFSLLAVISLVNIGSVLSTTKSQFSRAIVILDTSLPKKVKDEIKKVLNFENSSPIVDLAGMKIQLELVDAKNFKSWKAPTKKFDFTSTKLSNVKSIFKELSPDDNTIFHLFSYFPKNTENINGLSKGPLSETNTGQTTNLDATITTMLHEMGHSIGIKDHDKWSSIYIMSTAKSSMFTNQGIDFQNRPLMSCQSVLTRQKVGGGEKVNNKNGFIDYTDKVELDKNKKILKDALFKMLLSQKEGEKWNQDLFRLIPAFQLGAMVLIMIIGCVLKDY